MKYLHISSNSLKDKVVATRSNSRYSRRTFSTLFIVLCLMLVLLPFIYSAQDILTRTVLHFKFYRIVQDIIVPHELKIMAAIINGLGIESKSGNAYIMYLKNGRPEVIFLAWNCVGWQSFLFLIVTIFYSLSGGFKKLSTAETFLIGVLGTYLVNIFRLVLVVIMYYFTGNGIVLVFHNYFSNLLSITWLFVFWWLAYTYVLQAREERRV